MNFEKLLAKANSNVKKHNRKVVEADFEMESDRRRKLERLKLEKQLEKKELKRKLPPPPPKPKPKEFVIPKKNEVGKKPEVDKESIAKFFQKKEDQKRQAEIQKKQEKEELIRLRLQANGGKANKKISKHFGLTPISLQANYSTNRDHLDLLIKQNEREQEEQDKLSSLYRTGVYKAVEKKNQMIAATSKKHSIEINNKVQTNGNAKSSSTFNNLKSQTNSLKNSWVRPPETINNQKLSEQKHQLLKKTAPVDDFYTLMVKAEQNRKIDPKKLENEIFLSPPLKKVSKIEVIQQRKPSIEIGVSAGKTLNYWGQRAQKKEEHENFTENLQKKQNIKEKLNASTKSMGMFRNNIKVSSPSSSASIRTTVVDPEFGVVKRYLPGDVRYKASLEASTSKQQLNSKTSFKQLNNYTSGSQILKNNNQFKTLEPKDNFGHQKHRAVNESSFIRGSSIDRNSTTFSSKDTEKAALKVRLRQMEEENAKNLREKEELMRKLKHRQNVQPKDNVLQQQRRGTSKDGRLEESRFKHDEERQKQLKMRMTELKERQRLDEINRRRRAAKILGRDGSRYQQQSSSSSKDNRLINYSESDDDEDLDLDSRYPRLYHDDDDEEEEDEYDPELDDFIDDSIEEGTVSREMLEESLKAVNQRYDRKKYAMIDKMPERCMTARFSDIEKEERRSAKIAYLDDLREAQRGSRALK